jgi:predicted small metal-binding protein
MKLTCKELAVKDCDLVAEGEAPADIVEQVVEHLQGEHGIDMPDVDAILTGITTGDELVASGFDKVAIVIVERLREKLGIEPDTAPSV